MTFMREVAGNLWDFDCTVRAIPTNGYLKLDGTVPMGAGLAQQAALRFPNLPEILGKCVASSGNHVHVLRHDIVAFPTKNDWRQPSDLALIERSAHELLDKANLLQWKCVGLPRVGCGKGNLRWSQVRPVLEAVFGNDPRFVIVDNS